ncbi:MAG: hypothetical protein D6737_20350 [Chloroflexi bacterium]|nr:MAG: hypothetical protein D6737_20350 [Chloroflexota bacterium]
MAGLEKCDRSEYLFGEVDIPILEEGEWPIPPFDNTRNNTLNRQNPDVVVLLGWIAEELEAVRQILVEREQERRKSQQAKELAEEAKKLAEIINNDFVQLELELELARRVSRRAGKQLTEDILDVSGELWPGDGDVTTQWQETGQPHGSGKRGQNPAGPGDIPRPGPSVSPGDQLGGPKDVKTGSRKRRRAVFSIDYVNETAQKNRSRYDPNTKTIYINLDHPQIASAFKAGGNRTDSRQFRDICYEVAAVEYALAVLSEKNERDEWYNADDALYDVRSIINRITRRFAEIL